MQSNFRMVMRVGPSAGKIFPLEKSEIFVGRDLSNDVVINDPEISRRHARLFMQGNSYVLEDLGSTNGTFVNGQRLMGSNILRPGDSIAFGERVSLVFESTDYDTDATVVSQALHPTYDNQGSPQIHSPQPSRQPVATSYPPSVSAPALGQVDNFAGQMPSAYAPEMPVQRRFPVVWIVVTVVLLLICLCLFIAIWNAPEEFWCLFPVWPEGYCP